MNSRSLRWLAALAAAIVCLGLGGCGYNNLQRQDENVKAAWSEVVNQYQRRADLVPNLVNTVKGFAQQEQQVLIGVTEARAKVGSIQVSADVLNNPEAFAKFQAAQNQLTQSLKSLLAVSERYPDLKSNENFRDLQVQLEGTENRITVARNRYIDAVRQYNINVRSFPTNLTAKMFDFQVKPNFTVADESAIAAAPTVDFGGARPTGGPVSGPAAAPATPAPAGTPPPRGVRRSSLHRPPDEPQPRVAGQSGLEPAGAAGGIAVPRAVAATDSEARGACHRSDRDADGCPAVHARREAAGSGGTQGIAARGSHGAHDPTGGDRAVRDPRARPMESGPQGHR